MGRGVQNQNIHSLHISGKMQCNATGNRCLVLSSRNSSPFPDRLMWQSQHQLQYLPACRLPPYSDLACQKNTQAVLPCWGNPHVSQSARRDVWCFWLCCRLHRAHQQELRWHSWQGRPLVCVGQIKSDFLPCVPAMKILPNTDDIQLWNEQKQKTGSCFWETKESYWFYSTFCANIFQQNTVKIDEAAAVRGEYSETWCWKCSWWNWVRHSVSVVKSEFYGNNSSASRHLWQVINLRVRESQCGSRGGSRAGCRGTGRGGGGARIFIWQEENTIGTCLHPVYTGIRPNWFKRQACKADQFWFYSRWKKDENNIPYFHCGCGEDWDFGFFSSFLKPSLYSNTATLIGIWRRQNHAMQDGRKWSTQRKSSSVNTPNLFSWIRWIIEPWNSTRFDFDSFCLDLRPIGLSIYS